MADFHPELQAKLDDLQRELEVSATGTHSSTLHLSFPPGDDMLLIKSSWITGRGHYREGVSES